MKPEERNYPRFNKEYFAGLLNAPVSRIHYCLIVRYTLECDRLIPAIIIDGVDGAYLDIDFGSLRKMTEFETVHKITVTHRRKGVAFTSPEYAGWTHLIEYPDFIRLYQSRWSPLLN